MSEHRPWLVPIKPFDMPECWGEERKPVEAPTIAARRSTPSMRKLVLPSYLADLVRLEHLWIGTIDLCADGPYPGILFLRDQPELFDVPVEAGTPIRLVFSNLSGQRIVGMAGALYGL